MTAFTLVIYGCAEEANSLLRPSLGYVTALGAGLVTIIIDAGFAGRVARLFLLLNQFRAVKVRSARVSGSKGDGLQRRPRA